MKLNINITPIYQYTEWEVIEEEFKIENNYRNETAFALGNGYIGTRGTFEEGYGWDIKTGLEGNFINGFYESENIRYGELVYGCPKKSQTMLNVTNGKCIKLCIDDEEFNMLEGEISEYRRTLSLKEAILTRSLVWQSPKGKKIQLKIRRLVSLNNKHLMAICYEVTPLNFNGEIRIISTIEGDVINHTHDTNALIDYGPYGKVLSTEKRESVGDYMALFQRTKNTRLPILCASLNYMETEAQYCSENIQEQDKVGVIYKVKSLAGKKITFNKYVVYHTERDCTESDMQVKVKEKAYAAKTKGFECIAKEQIDFMDKFWSGAEVVVHGDPALQQGIRFNLFHILQSAGRDGKTGAGAKGLTGEGYEGHYFWDTEMYLLPFFTSTNPEITKTLLDFRYNTLDQARARAREMSHVKGALYPWRTINGEEASAYYPQGTAQYHINADIAYALNQYIEITGDVEYLTQKGAEMFIETARLWYDLGAFTDTREGRFCICDVTGPDEYTSVVDNNCYTNLMARENLMYGYNAVKWMIDNRNENYKSLAEKIDLGKDEPQQWKRAADKMYFPYDEKLGVYGQDDTFLYKKPIDINGIPEEKLPMLLNFHPLVVYRYRVSKQADLIFGMFLLSHKFSLEEKRRNFDFYETVTLHDSSLSTCIFSIMACELGYYEKAYDYFTCTSRLDLDDYHKNVYSGIHAANMAGTWMCLVYGFGGMRIHDDELSFKPYLPEKWDGYSFKIAYRGRTIKVTIGKNETTYEIVEGTTLNILHNSKQVILNPSKKEVRINEKV